MYTPAYRPYFRLMPTPHAAKLEDRLHAAGLASLTPPRRSRTVSLAHLLPLDRAAGEQGCHVGLPVRRAGEPCGRRADLLPPRQPRHQGPNLEDSSTPSSLLPGSRPTWGGEVKQTKSGWALRAQLTLFMLAHTHASMFTKVFRTGKTWILCFPNWRTMMCRNNSYVKGHSLMSLFHYTQNSKWALVVILVECAGLLAPGFLVYPVELPARPTRQRASAARRVGPRS